VKREADRPKGLSLQNSVRAGALTAQKMETSPGVDNRGLETSPTIQMRVTIIDGMDRMNKNPVNPVILSKKPRRRRLSSKGG